MTAAVIVSPHIVMSADLTSCEPLELLTTTSDARKRRRDVLAAQKRTMLTKFGVASSNSVAAATASSTTMTLSYDSSSGEQKRVKLESDRSSSPSDVSTVSSLATSNEKSKNKKLQMKYDPDTPMSKEEAAIWRREQRRKRNRESAAASRQRQRDRLTELEVEVDDMKKQFYDVMKKISVIEAEKRVTETDSDNAIRQFPRSVSSSMVVPPAHDAINTLIPTQETTTFSIITPCSSPITSFNFESTGHCAGIQSSVPVKVPTYQEDDNDEEDKKQLQLLMPTKMFSQPAQLRIVHLI